MDNVIYPSFGGGSCVYEPSVRKKPGETLTFRQSLRAVGSTTLKFNFFTVTLNA